MFTYYEIHKHKKSFNDDEIKNIADKYNNYLNNCYFEYCYLENSFNNFKDFIINENIFKIDCDYNFIKSNIKEFYNKIQKYL